MDSSLAELPVVLRDNAGAVVRFQGANLPGQPFVNNRGGMTMQIDQFADRATLHWESFNISKDNEVNFVQPRSSSIALNRVMGDANLPSMIDGHITANGRVYLINQNGVLFGPNTVVDTRSFIASTLNIDDDIYERIGIENAINEPGNPAAFASFGAPMGAIVIEEGARISSDKNGRVMILAPSISNAGTIESPEGQVILAAAEDQVYIAPAGKDEDIRGLVIGVSTGGDVTNLGELIAERGNISLLGLAVNQDGLARATTSISLNGSIKLVAQDMNGGLTTSGTVTTGYRPVATRGGDLELGANSVTEVLPEITAETAPDAQQQAPSRILLEGEKVTLKGGSRVVTPGGEVIIEANAKPVNVEFDIPLSPAGATEEIVVEADAVIDVSGYDQSVVSVARNFVEVEARGNELADAPLQRDGVLRNQTLTVDIREGSPLLNLAGAKASIERDAGERLSAGGSIKLRSKGNITLEQGSVLDISGGRVNYTGADVISSKLVTADGRVVDISEADPDLLYTGVFGSLEIPHEKWGVNDVYTSPFGFFEPGYIEGRDAGLLELVAPDLRFDSNLIAAAFAGVYQRNAPVDFGTWPELLAVNRAFDEIPLGGRLFIHKLNKNLQDFVIGDAADIAAPENGHPDGADAAFVLLPEVINESGIARVDIDNAGRIIVNHDLDMPAYGTLELLGTQVLVESDITVPGGTIALEARSSGDSESSPGLGSLGDLTAILPDSSTALLRLDGVLDVGGTWTNDSASVNPVMPQDPVITAGGNISLLSTSDLSVNAGSLLDASGGAWLAEDGDFTGGVGGTIALGTTSAGGVGKVPRLDIQGELRAFGTDGGGSLLLAASGMRVITSPAGASPDFALDGSLQFDNETDPVSGGNTLTITDDTFRRGGFAAFDLDGGSGGFEVAPGVRVEPLSATAVLDPAGMLAVQRISASTVKENGHPLEMIPSGIS
ncbi:MAG: filamentous hemagglutinin N-terminal domain-containing protein, partial [Gammaproteobacteria bacterium]